MITAKYSKCQSTKYKS